MVYNIIMTKTNTTENTVRNGRNPDGTFAIGNPGKPKGAKHLTTKLFDALENMTKDGKSYSDLLIQRILNDAIVKGNPSMIHMIMNYVDGMPQQGLDLTTGGDKLEKSNTDVMELARRISSELKEKKTMPTVLKTEEVEETA